MNWRSAAYILGLVSSMLVGTHVAKAQGYVDILPEEIQKRVKLNGSLYATYNFDDAEPFFEYRERVVQLDHHIWLRQRGQTDLARLSERRHNHI